MAERGSEEAPTADDNLLTRHKHIAESIEMIRQKKSQLLSTLRGLSQSENPDRVLMGKLIEAFDVMTAQEASFLGVMKNIVDIHEQATKDVAAENDVAKTSEGNVSMEKMTEEVAASDEASKDDEEQDEALIKETLKELEEVSLQALAAAQLNEKLVETLQRHKKNRNSMLELRKNKTEELKTAASAAIAEVKKAKQEVSANRNEIQKKQREADELRKAALKAGIQVGAEEEKRNEEITAALAAVANEVERIPPIPVVEVPKTAAKDSEDPLEVRRKEIRENIRKEKEKREQVNQVIREKLAAMEARKQRMKEIRRLLTENQATASSVIEESKKKLEKKLSQDEGVVSLSTDADSSSETKTSKETNGACPPESTPQDSVEDPLDDDSNGDIAKMTEDDERTRQDIENTFRSAEQNLLNLTQLRLRLEKIQAQGEAGLSQDDVDFIGRLDEVAGVSAEEAESRSDGHAADQEISSGEAHSGPERVSPRSVTPDEGSDTLKHIEQLLLQQTTMLEELLRLNQPSNSRRASVVHSSSCRLLELLHAASPALLRGFAACLLQLADGIRHPPHLERILNAICERGPQRLETTTAPVQSNAVINGHIHQGIKKNELEQMVSGIMLEVQAILGQSEELEEEVEQRVRESVVLSTAALFPNVPRSLIDAQLGPLVADALAAYSDEPSHDVADELCADIVRLLCSELGFFHLINSLNCIPDPYPPP